MPPLNKSTAAATLLLAFAPLAVQDIAAAAAATTETTPEERVTVPEVEQTVQPVEDATPTPEPVAEEPVAPQPVEAEAAAPEPTPTPAPVADTTPAASPAPSPAAETEAVTPNATTINVSVSGDQDAVGQPGQLLEPSTFNLLNESGFTVPSRTLAIHWTLTGPGTFPTAPRPYSVAQSGRAKVTNCAFPTPTQTDCDGGNPQAMGTGGNNYNHIRVPVLISPDALPGDVITVHGSFEPTAASGYENTNTATSTTWKVSIPLTAAVIDEPMGAVGPLPTVTGEGVPGGTVDVTVGDQAPVTVDVGPDGHWSHAVTRPLGSGPVEVTAVQHRNGFTATAATATLQVDATAPDAPQVDAPGTLDDPTGPITGSTEPGATVVIRDPAGNELGSDVAGPDGSFSVRLDAPLPEGASDLVVRATDEFGNVSEATTVSATVPDTTAPDAPVVADQDLGTSTGPVLGTAEPGSTVIVRDASGNELGHGVANDAGDFSVPLDAPLPEGAHGIEVIAIDAADNVSPAASATVTAPDVTPPGAPISTTPEFLDDSTGPITGSAEPDSTVIVRDSAGNEIGRGQARPDGQFSIVLEHPLSNGGHDLSLVARDAAGNVSTPTPISVDVDTVAPSVPTITSPTDLADGHGPITGTTEPDALVIVRDADGNELGRGTANEDGEFTVELDAPLADGSHDLRVVADDEAGNESAARPVTVNVDTVAPDAPVVTSPTDLADATGPITGTAEPGSTVIVRDEDGNEIGSGVAGPGGDFSVELDEPLADGGHDLSVVAKDKAGNVSEPTDAPVDIDTEAPTAPVVTSPSDLADGKGPITGTAEPGSTVIVRDEDGNEIGSGVAGPGGDFSVELDEPVADGAHDLSVVAKDKAGNVSDPTDAPVDIDTEAPTAPVVTSPSDLADGKGPITGTAEPGSTVVVRDEDGNVIGTGAANDEGDFSVELDEPLADGAHDLSVVAKDKAGNVSDATAAPVDIDTEAPTAPVVTSPSDLADGEGPITGTAEPGSTVIVRDEDGNVIGTGAANDEGDFSVELDEPLADGSHDLEVVAQDKAGNISDATAAPIVVDTEAPDAPVVTSPSDLADGKGPITGTAEPGSTVIVRDEDGNEIGSGVAGPGGDFSVELDEPLADGAHDLSVVAKDKAGNVSDAIDAPVNIDTEAPTAPVVTSPSDLADGKGPITGTAEPGSTVIIRDEDGNEIGSGVAGPGGDFSVELDEPLADGSHDLEVVAQDGAGNVSAPRPVAVDVDTEAPDAPVVTSPSDLADGKGPITGTAEPGATVVIRDEDGNEIGSGVAGPGGDFSVELDEPLADGSHDLEVVAKDKAGNVSDATAAPVVVDTVAPTAPVVTSPSDLADGKGPITGTAEPGATVIVRDEDGNEIGSGVAGPGGDFSVELDEPLADGAHDLEIVAQDEAGNVSDATDARVDIDTEAPTAPVVTSPSDLADGKGPITGTAEPGATVIIRDEDGNEIGSGVAGPGGDFSVELDEPLSEGDHDLVVVSRDRVGNESAETAVRVTGPDVTAPAAPVLAEMTDIADGLGTVRGTAEPGATVIVRDADGREIGRGTADADGAFAFRTTVPLDPGAHLLSVVAVDRAGNVSEGRSMLVTVIPEAEESSDTIAPVVQPGGVLPSIGSGVSSTEGSAPPVGHTVLTDRQLAYTGVELSGWLAAAIGAIGLGALLRLLARRRDQRS